MSKGKCTPLEVREQEVKNYLESNQSALSWSKEHHIPSSTFAKWVREYKKQNQEVIFIPLSKKKQTIKDSMNDSNEILVEIGSCKIHIPEHLSSSFFEQAWKVVSNSSVSI